ncbi:MAG: DNA endonuclease SmrA [Pseudomonadota bacterium]
MSDNDDDFLTAMGDVKPLQAEKRVSLKKPPLDSAVYNARRQAAENIQSTAPDPLSESEVCQLDPLALLDYRRPGVQHGVYKQLRLGRYRVDARLDLHKMTVEQARKAVYQFVHDCIHHDIRCALMTHGKGEGRKSPAVLKSHVAHWLPQIDSVLAFHSAQKHHGGLGACYILLKKSEAKRLENLEKHQKRH